MKKFLPHGKKSVSFACGSLCGIVCCPPPDESPLEGPFGDLIGRELLQLGRKLQLLESRLRARRMGLQGFSRGRMAPPPDGLSAPLYMGGGGQGHDWDLISEASANFSVSTVKTGGQIKSAEEFYEKFGKNVSNDKLTEWLLCKWLLNWVELQYHVPNYSRKQGNIGVEKLPLRLSPFPLSLYRVMLDL